MIDVGIVGLGGAGRAHARRLRRNKSVRTIVGFDIKPVDVAGVEVVDSLEALLSKVQAVSICTPDHLHLQGIIRCLEAGKHVLVEKPMVASHAEALELEQHLCAHPDLVFGVHHQMRHTPAFRKARELIADGSLGRVFYLEANYWHDMTSRSTMFDNWRMEHGQSLIFGHSCHPLDLLMYLMDGKPLSHSTFLSKVGFDAYATPYTSATTMLRFAGDIVAKSHVNSCCAFPQFNNLVVLGDRGTYIDGVLYRDGTFTQVSDFFGAGRTALALNVLDIKIPGRLVSLAFNAYLRSIDLVLRTYLHVFNRLAGRLMSRPDFAFRQYPLTVYNHDGACQVMIDNFVAAVQGHEPVLVGYSDAARVIELCEAVEADGLSNLGDTAS